MPQQQIVPTWLAWNNCNFPTQSGIQDLRTGQDFPAGGLNTGDYFDATEKEANSASALANGLLHSGRYRLVQVDSAATVANVKTGTVGYARSGSFVQGAVISAAGSGGTAGSYTFAVPAGTAGGSGAILQVVVNASGVVSNVSVLQGGFNYNGPTAALSVTLTGIPGLTGATVVLQLNNSPNIVTSFDQATTLGTLVRPVVFLNSITPGQFGFIQELGLATVLTGASAGSAATGDWVNVGTGGVVTTTAASGSPIGVTIGQAIDKPVANQLFKAYLSQSPTVQD
jgi:hypothetical protein